MTVKTDRSGTAVAQPIDRLKDEDPRVSTGPSNLLAAGRPRPTG